MNQREAFRETIELAAKRGVPDLPGSDYGMDHFYAMKIRIDNDAASDADGRQFSEAKLGRWLGWLQGVLCAQGWVTLEEMKQLNKRWAE